MSSPNFISYPGEIGGFQREETQDIIHDIDWSTRNVMLGYDVAGTYITLVFVSLVFQSLLVGCYTHQYFNRIVKLSKHARES